ncbi:FG-GAP-like repeat-containing protein [Flavivirga rizhaonensis]|uniref:T9SS type A sorting domain-containing protein n=1 Tax=Flavivirga rizhaonensis TaxID=2559571 RepID=A0A4S1E2U7_9FLAO|nr:FG-GAP-like repeat-containing protein [Flavivirga rizhaonensis]TGV04879.1 T9SS type A sorting domain-containing protein [Flavivirga rizhaonensis]
MKTTTKIFLIVIALLEVNLTFGQNPVFKELSVSIGIEDVTKVSDWAGNGASLADYDNDGDIDFFLATAFDIPDRLYRNKGDGTFEEIANTVGLASSTRSRSSVWFDYNNDGLLDLLVLGDCFNTDICTTNIMMTLYKQTSTGNFEDITNISNIVFNINDYPNASNIAVAGSAAGDINNDGFLDILITVWGGKSIFFLNNGNGTFKDISKTSHLGTHTRFHWQPIFYDFNFDGLLDIYCNIDFDANVLWLNNGDNTFDEVANTYNADSSFNEMGMALGDYDNDGDMDIYATNITRDGKHNILLSNNTNKGIFIGFTDVSLTKDVANNGWDWGTTFFDANNDGWLDLVATNGWNDTEEPIDKSRLWINDTKGGFTDDSSEANFNDSWQATTLLAFDMERDGDLDLIQTLKENTGTNKPAIIYENQLNNNTGDLTNYVVVKPRMLKTNRFAIGAVIKIKVGNLISMRLITAGTSTYGQEPAEAFFGLGSATSIDELRVEWPDGETTTLENIDANQVIVVTNENIDTEIQGCTDPNSCNYDFKATVDNGSCVYLTTSNILGAESSTYFSTETYRYAIENNESVTWSVKGGEVISKSANTVTVRWGIETLGEVIANVSNDICTNEKRSLHVLLGVPEASSKYSIARIWNEALLEAIRGDYARPTVHARNLFHTSIALYDSWAIYEGTNTYLIGNIVNNFQSSLQVFKPNKSIEISKKEAMSYAAYRLLTHRFKNSPSASTSLERFDLIMNQLGYDTSYTSTNYTSGNPADLGNYIAQTIIDYGLTDNSREVTDYDNAFYQPVNPSLILTPFGQPTNIVASNRWQPLTFNTFIDQSGNVIPGATPEFLNPEWGAVHPFTLSSSDKQTLSRDGNNYVVYHNPETPPQLSSATQTSREQYKWNFSLVSLWSSHLDPSDGVLWDISPNSIGNIDINLFPTSYSDYPDFYDELNGGDISAGHSMNPVTRQPYATQMVPRADYARVLAEFWADGPDSETPPGHWFTILNYVTDHELFEKKFNGQGNELSPLEWDVKAYFILGGAMHDAAITAWGIKGWHDYIRPISAIRYMCELGQSTNNSLSNYNPDGIALKQGYIEVVEAGDPLSGSNNEHVGKIKLYAWKGHDFINNASTDVAGVGWILAENWWPYQRPSFVTPPFAGFVSGHSTFSRAAAEVMTLITGDEYFPGGMGEFVAKKDEFLVFEKGPSVDVKLQWATYRDASDQTSLSRIWGGIHPPADDIPGRIIGEQIGVEAYNFALPYFNLNSTISEGKISVYPNPADDTLYFKNLAKESEIIVYALSGKMIKKDVVQFDTDGYSLDYLPVGVYLINVHNANQNHRQLVIKK